MNQNKKPLKRQEEFKRLRGVTMKTSDQKTNRKGREDQGESGEKHIRASQTPGPVPAGVAQAAFCRLRDGTTSVQLLIEPW